MNTFTRYIYIIYTHTHTYDNIKQIKSKDFSPSQQKLRQESQMQVTHIPVKHLMPLDNMGTLRIGHKTDGQGKHLLFL